MDFSEFLLKGKEINRSFPSLTDNEVINEVANFIRAYDRVVTFQPQTINLPKEETK